MYEEFYGLRERPFSLLPDPDFLYLSPQHKLARAYLEYGINERMGFVVLTGEVGTGKTTLIKSLLRARENNQRVGVLYQTSVGAGDLLEVLLKEFEVRGRFSSRTERLAAFNQFLVNAFARGEHVVLLVDEAQNLSPDALEELRLLSNLQTEKEPLLQVILVGQPDLRKRLRHPSLRQLAQRVSVHYHLRPLDEKETREYIRFRLARAGSSGIFTDSALDRLYEFTKGVPRRLNAWCDLALVAGFAEGRQELDGEFIDAVFSAQGGSLEGPEGEEAAAGEDSLQLIPAERSSGHDNGLDAVVRDLSGRLTRLEGLVLEINSQIVEILTRVLSNSGPSLAEPRTGSIEAIPAPPEAESQPPESVPPPKRSWWSQLWGR